MKNNMRGMILSGMVAAGVLLVLAAPDALAGQAGKQLMPLPPVPDPTDNKITPAKVELGKLLYFDPKLSGDASVSCADCHDPKQGWGFNEPICRGYPGTVHWRNCQTVVNTGYLSKLFWEGSDGSLESQARTAAQGAVAGNGEDDVMEWRIRQVPEYVKMFKAAFGTLNPVLRDAWAAIAVFERETLTQKNSPLDRYLNGDKSALSATAVKGMELFTGKANCIECHNGPMLTDEKYYNLGVPRPQEFADVGLNTITYRWELYQKGITEAGYRDLKDDPGLYFRTKYKSDMGKFRTQPLRYLKYTAPYMHAGQFFTLEEVVDFYNKGGGENDFTKMAGNKTKVLKPLDLTKEEKAALVTFLTEISGEQITMPVPKVPTYAAYTDVAGLTQAQAKRVGIELLLSSEKK